MPGRLASSWPGRPGWLALDRYDGDLKPAGRPYAYKSLAIG